MGELLERVNLANKVYGNGLADNYKNNSLFFFNKYKESDVLIPSIRKGEIQIGRFYFLHYRDDSNWMRYSPVFTVSVKKFDNLIILIAINFNFLPIQVRIPIFDKFIKKQDFENDSFLEVDYEGVYKELLQYGFEYSIVEYNLAQVEMVHRISMGMVPRFLVSGHPINIYDPLKLYEIWKAKLHEHQERHNEMSNLIMKDLFDIRDDLTEEYTMLKDHIKRIKRSYQKYGK